jgi:hypothetical protein
VRSSISRATSAVWAAFRSSSSSRKVCTCASSASSKERDQGIHHPKAISGKSVKANRRGTNSIDSQDYFENYFEKNGANDFSQIISV